MNSDLLLAKEELKKDDRLTAVLVKDGKVLSKKNTRGIRPVIELVDEFGSKLQGCVLADKVIGKAAAMICAAHEIEGVFAKVISLEAKKILEGQSIEVDYERIVPYILNRNKDGRCPMEKLSESAGDYNELIKKIMAFLKTSR